MSIQAECPVCHFGFRVSEDQAGRRGKCPKCKADMSIPSPSDAMEVQAERAYGRFFMDTMSVNLGLSLPESMPPAPQDLKAAKADLIDARQDMEVAREECHAALHRWNTLGPRAESAATAEMILKAGYRLKKGDLDLDEPSLSAAQTTLSSAEEGLRRIRPTFETYTDAAARRLALGVSLLQNDQVLARVAGGALRKEQATTIYPITAILARRLVPELQALIRAGKIAALHLMIVHESKQEDRRLLESFLSAAEALERKARAFQRMLSEIKESPLFGDDGPIPFVAFILPEVPPAQEIIELIEAVMQAQSKVSYFYLLWLGRLAVCVEEVEEVFGLAPLPKPAED